MHDYPAFRYIHQDLSGAAYRNAMQLTFEYYIALTWLDDADVVGCWDGEELVGGMLVEPPGTTDTFDPAHPVSVEYRSKIGVAAWDRLDKFELMVEGNMPQQDEGYFEIVLIGVDPKHHGNGYGRYMLDHVANLAREHPTTNLVCLATESPAKVPFYEYFGYEPVSTASLGPIKSTSFLLDAGRT